MRYLLVISMAGLAACMDLLAGKVKNQSIFIFWLTGLMYQVFGHDGEGILNFLSGAIAPILILFWLFRFRMLGAGDIKLLSALGGIMGISAVITCIAVAFFLGAILSAALLAFDGSLGQRLRYFTDYFIHFAQTKEIRPYYRPGARLENIHFCVPILMSVMLYTGGFY